MSPLVYRSGKGPLLRASTILHNRAFAGSVMFVNSLRAQSRCVASSSSRSPSLRISTLVSSLASRKTTRPLRALSTDAASTTLQPSESTSERNEERSPLPVPRLLRETGELPHTEKTNKSASHTLYIGNLSPSVTEAELQAMFGVFGDVSQM